MAELPWFHHSVDTDSYEELSPIPLPSSFDVLPFGWKDYAKQEEKLRVAQADEALEALRGEIADKSFLYRDNRDFATGKRGRTRIYRGINEVERRMRFHIKCYESTRWALARLGGKGGTKKYARFQRVDRTDTRAVTSIFDPNRAGERDANLSWLWQASTGGDSTKSDYLKECA